MVFSKHNMRYMVIYLLIDLQKSLLSAEFQVIMVADSVQFDLPLAPFQAFFPPLLPLSHMAQLVQLHCRFSSSLDRFTLRP